MFLGIFSQDECLLSVIRKAEKQFPSLASTNMFLQPFCNLKKKTMHRVQNLLDLVFTNTYVKRSMPTGLNKETETMI